MQIFVNDQVLEASMTGEENLMEVYESVNDWTVKNNKYILGFLVDRSERSVKQLGDIKPEEVKRFDFFIGDEVEMMVTTIDELDRYIDQVGTVLYENQVNNPDEDFYSLKDGMHWMQEIMKSVSAILKMDLAEVNAPVFDKGELSVSEILNRMDELSSLMLEKRDPELIEDFLHYLRGLKFFVMKLGSQIRLMNAAMEELMESLEDFENKMDLLIEELVQINIDFNTGKDQEALLALDDYIEKLNHYLSVLYAIDFKYMNETGKSYFMTEPPGQSIQEHTKKITEFLRDITLSLETNDLVTAGDILEYEITESLRNLKPHLSEMSQFLLARK